MGGVLYKHTRVSIARTRLPVIPLRVPNTWMCILVSASLYKIVYMCIYIYIYLSVRVKLYIPAYGKQLNSSQFYMGYTSELVGPFNPQEHIKVSHPESGQMENKR